MVTNYFIRAQNVSWKLTLPKISRLTTGFGRYNVTSNEQDTYLHVKWSNTSTDEKYPTTIKMENRLHVSHFSNNHRLNLFSR